MTQVPKEKPEALPDDLVRAMLVVDGVNDLEAWARSTGHRDQNAGWATIVPRRNRGYEIVWTATDGSKVLRWRYLLDDRLLSRLRYSLYDFGRELARKYLPQVAA